MQKIQAKLRRESIPTAAQDQPTDFWLLFANQQESRISDKDMVKALDDIFKEHDNKTRDDELVKYLVSQKLLSKNTQFKSYWLEPVEDALSAPIKIFLNPSGKCPNHCKTCSILMSRSQTLDDEIAREVMRQVVQMPVFWLTMVGGEPVDYPLFFEFAEQAINYGINVSTTISGVGLTKAWAEKARDLGIRLKVSLDGPKKVNDVQRPGTYESAIKAVKLSFAL